MVLKRFFLAVALSVASTAVVYGDGPTEAIPTSTAPSIPNLPSPTFGGKQFWTDEFVYLDWRIQRNVTSDHYRLLDEKNVRRAWGSYEQCRAAFSRLKVEQQLAELKPNVVIVLHGLVRSRESMSDLCDYLAEKGDYTALNVSYASSRERISDHAAALGRVIQQLEGVQEINFVAHSMGNLVIRHYLADQAAQGREIDRRIHRIVMLAPPNNGTEMALRFRNNFLFQTIWGESGHELAEDWTTLEKRLGTPPCAFGVIAGGKGDDDGYSPLVKGDDDFVVGVEETRLPGAADFRVVPTLHGTIMDHPTVQEFTLQFLRYGYFESAATRQPIPRAAGSADE